MKKSLTILLIVCLGAVVAAFLYRELRTRSISGARQETGSLVPASPVAAPAVAEGLPVPPPSAVPAAASGRPVAKPSLSYEQAVKQYEGRRIQFDPDCRAFPAESTYKNGTELMLDNRAGVARSIVFNLKTYKVSAYGFVIVSATSTALPGITYLDCGDRQNVAKVTMQK